MARREQMNDNDEQPPMITEEMLRANPEFVEKIKQAADQPGVVMTPEQFAEWLNQF